jgi:hypothetical protein
VDEGDRIPSLPVLRKLTRAIEAHVRRELTDYLSALTTLLRPEMVFGKLILGGQKDWVVKSDQALRDLRALYDKLAPAPPFNLRTDLVPPFDLGGLSLEITPVEYLHVAQGPSGARRITVRCPLTWTLSYKGFSPAVFRQMLESRTPSAAELQRFLLAYLTLHLVTRMQPGVLNVLEGLRFPLTTIREPEFADLPITRVGVSVSTERPPESVLLESAELTGVDAFEEVVNVADIQRLRDPLRDRLLEMVQQHAPEVLIA